MPDLAAAIADRLAGVRERTLALVEPLDEAGLHRSPSPIMSPPVWDLGHIAAYEELWLVGRLCGAPSLHPDLARVYDAFETPRAVRGEVAMLGAAESRAYMRRVRERTLEVLAGADLGDGGPALTARGLVYEMVAQHEAQHTETMLQTLQLMPAGAYVPPPPRPLPAPPGGGGADWVAVPGGSFVMGAGAPGFAYDCERPAHARRLAPFGIARRPATAGAHLAFMADGGYDRPGLWSPEGWAWRSAAGVRAPLYWEPDGGGGWVRRRFDRVEAVDPAEALCHVSYWEAEAHARWAGGRLPTEAEWERAARHDPGRPDDDWAPWGGEGHEGRANLDQLAFGAAPAGAYPDGASPAGCEQMLGDVWEWTSTAFTGYPGFRAFPYAEYAEAHFGHEHRVLRGGSWATQPLAARTTFRNWDLPQRRQLFAGLRVARDAEEAS